MNKKIILSLSVIGIVAVIAIGGTVAFFSDTETSTGNTFTAGAIDLKIDNESYVTGPDGLLMRSKNNSWQLADLVNQLFFSFEDLKPGDIGEDTISLHVNNNDAWACMSIDLTGTPENDQTEPESELDQTSGAEEGELQNELYFAFWADDGDNVYENDEQIFAQGLVANLFDGENWALADSQTNVWGYSAGTPLTGVTEYYVGKVWCYGVLTPEAFPQGPNTPPTERGTGFVCDGSQVGNESQTDGIIADVEFYAVQSRNNAGFMCSSMNPREIASTVGDGWASVDGQFTEAWQGDGRWGDGGTTAAEKEVRIGMPGGGSPIVEAHGDNTTGPWRNGVWEDFTLTFISPYQATLSIGNVSIDTGAGSTIPGADGKLGITIKTKSSGETVMVQNVKLDGISPVGADAISASNGAKASLVLSGATELSDGFTVTGQVKLSWSSTPTSNESMGILFQIEN